MPYVGGQWYPDESLGQYQVTDDERNDNGMMVWQELLKLPPDILSSYLQSISAGGDNLGIAPLSAILEQSLVNYPSISEDPSFGRNEQTGRLGYEAGRNTGLGRTIVDVIADMGQTGKLTAPGEGYDSIGSYGGQEISNKWENGGTKPWENPWENRLTDNGQTGGGGTIPAQPPAQIPQYNGEYDFMFGKDKLRGLADESLGRIRGLQPYQPTPFDFSNQQSPVVGDTRNLINALIQRYRGL